MNTLLFSIITSTIVFAIFKLFARFQVNVFHAVVFNYITAALCGGLLFWEDWSLVTWDNVVWLYWCGLCAVIFLSLFSLIGISSQRNGVGITSVAVKMSLALSMLFMAVAYREELTLMKCAGIFFALVGVFLVTVQKNTERVEVYWLPIILFGASALLDIILNFVQGSILQGVTPAVFTSMCFGMAGLLGLLTIVTRSALSFEKLTRQSMLAGITLGIPNFFSIYLLMQSYRDVSWADSSVLGVTNVGIVILTAILGRVLFDEALTARRIFGLANAVIAIALLSFG